MKSSIEIYKGKKYLYVRYDHMTLEEIQKEGEEMTGYMGKSTEKFTLVLVDTSGTLISPAVLNEFKKTSSAAGTLNPQKTAILGMTGTRKVLLEIVNKFSKNPTVPFDDKQSALDWLVS